MNGKEKILITGATGCIGSNLVNTLLQNSTYHLALVVRDTNKAKSLFYDKVSCISSKCKDFKEKIVDFSPDIVIHLASYSSSSDELCEINKLIESNIIFTSILLDTLSECNVKLFINTGSFSEYYNNDDIPSPTYFYSATKISASSIIDYYSKKNNFKVINAILYTVYGKKTINKKIIDYAIESLESNNSINMSDGWQVLDFIYIDDVVRFYTNIIYNFKKLSINHKNYFVGTAKGISIRELIQILEKITNKKANINWGVIQDRVMDTKKAVANIYNAKNELQWSANYDIHTGLKKYLNELNGNKNV